MSKWLSLLSLMISSCLMHGQEPSYNFHLLDQGNGLNEGTVLGFGQDKYGYIWIGTASGLNKFDGYSIINYLPDATDSSTIMQAAIYVIFRHTDGSLWIGGDNGLMEYDYSADKFNWIARTGIITELKQGPGNTILVSSTQGLHLLDPVKKTLSRYSDLFPIANDTLLNSYTRDIATWKNFVYLASKQGLIEVNLTSHVARKINLPTKLTYQYNRVEVTNDGEVWLSVMTLPHLIQTTTQFKEVKVMDYIFPEKASNEANAITDFKVDTKGRMWISTSLDGLCYYHKARDKFYNIVNNPLLPTSPVVNNITKIFQDDKGLIWLATTGFGVNYFDPYNTFFTTFLPAADESTPYTWKRVLSSTQDKNGNLWISTGEGVLCYDTSMSILKSFNNSPGKPDQLHYNSVRTVVADDPWIWFATGRGINRYNLESGKMDFFTAADGLPQGFYSHAFKDSLGTLWFCSKENDKLYFFEKGATRGKSIAEHPVMNSLKNVGVKMVYEDSHHRLWLGLNSFGVSMYDPSTGYFETWWNNDEDPNRRPGDYIASMAEDSSGVIWAGSRLGLFSYDFAEKKWVHHNEKNGFYNTKASCIQVDALNRLWIGTSKGLVMMDTSRLHSRLFDTRDGLPIYEFADMPSNVLRDGRFIYPMNKGLIIFNPLEYLEISTTPLFYISSFHVLSKPMALPDNPEALQSLNLKWNQNYFTIELTSPYFQNPGHTWYAYILEGFDQQWHYTQDRTVQYTNVPGGDYTFHYKASLDNVNWTGEEKTLTISIGTIFFKSWWFWSLIILCILYVAWQYYTMRINKQREIFALQSKTSTLEKEKTQIQYENLKQQLNPHFLFNSLTSLRSLIRVDQKLASQFVDGLSKTYRYLLRSGDNEVVTLEEEMNFVETFVQLQKTRFRDGLVVNIHVDPDCFQKMIAPVTLQNLLENAIKHNTTSEDNPLVVEIFNEGDTLLVRNNLQRYKHVESSNKRGLAGMQSLYRYLTSRPIEILEDENYFTVKIPLL